MSQLAVDWTDDGLLGSGAFGDVRLATFRGDPCTVKLVRVSREDLRASITGAACEEAAALSVVRHPHVIRLLRVVTAAGAKDRAGRAIAPCLVLERLHGGFPLHLILRVPGDDTVSESRRRTLLSLRDELATVDRRVGVLAHIASGVAAVHDSTTTHGDVKCENVLCRWDGDRWHVRLLDFGLSTATGLGSGGTRAYEAPELLVDGDIDDDGG
jgi:serine/threonine protein kinase